MISVGIPTNYNRKSTFIKMKYFLFLILTPLSGCLLSAPELSSELSKIELDFMEPGAIFFVEGETSDIGVEFSQYDVI